MSAEVHPAAATGFERATEEYERGRPEYPPAIVAWLAKRLDLRAGRVALDVGAGTGKLTRALLSTGARMIAVEPLGAMREVLALECPDADVRNGTAEALPLDDASIDVIVCGQAFHWFDGDRALREFRRVLRSGGMLALVWNIRMLDQPIQAAISTIIEPHRSGAPSHHDGRWREALEHTDLFALEDEHRVAFEQELDRERLADRVGSTSFVAALEARERGHVLDQVRALVPEEADTVRLGYVCETSLYAARA